MGVKTARTFLLINGQLKNYFQKKLYFLSRTKGIAHCALQEINPLCVPEARDTVCIRRLAHCAMAYQNISPLGVPGD